MRRRRLLGAGAQLLAIPAAPAILADTALHRFGPDFTFGVSSSAYQIEGAVRADGRGPGIWDVFCHEPGKIFGNATADTACDHYHHMPEDVSLIAAAGIRDYRFSVSWPRLFPTGAGPANGPGFAFYDRLLDELLKHGIRPWLCLYHWDLPQALQARGGWTNRDTAWHFADYATRAGKAFGDRVDHFMALNEGGVQAMFGYGTGAHAPGLRGKASWFSALHHLNLGQGLAIQALRAVTNSRVGTVTCAEPVRPSSDSSDDIRAADYFDAVWNGAVLDPLFKGSYPALVADDFAALCKSGDLEIIRQNIDVLGVNYYSRLHIQADAASPIGANFGPIHDTSRFTVMGWPIEPDGIFEVLTKLRREYGDQNFIIAENGFATTTRPGVPGRVNDEGRITYISDHLNFVQQAAAAGVRVSGYFIWALLDSFEWNDGMKWQFGLVSVDFKTLTRTPKDSYRWYAALIQANSGIPG